MLHAWKLEFAHPASGSRLAFEAAPPPEFRIA
jgi:23S rRNA pseudouridine1911/1915/1917 synthase